MSRPCETCSNQLPEGCYSNRQFCDDCRRERERRREYEQTPQRKEYQRKRKQTPEYKERMLEYDRKRKQTPEYKERMREYDRKYHHTPEHKEQRRKYDRNRAETLKFCQMIQTMAAWEDGKQAQ